MAKALGTTPEEEHRPGLAPLARVSIPRVETVVLTLWLIHIIV